MYTATVVKDGGLDLPPLDFYHSSALHGICQCSFELGYRCPHWGSSFVERFWRLRPRKLKEFSNAVFDHLRLVVNDHVIISRHLFFINSQVSVQQMPHLKVLNPIPAISVETVIFLRRRG